MLLGGNLVFERKGFHDIDKSVKVKSLSVGTYHDVLRIHRFDVTEPVIGGAAVPLSEPIDGKNPEHTKSTVTAPTTGPVHNLLKPVGSEGGPHEWKVTDEGMFIGDVPEGWAYYNSDYSPSGEYDLHVIAEVTKAEDGAALSLIVPRPEGGRINFDINPRDDSSCDAGFAPAGDVRKRGANQFGGNFGSRLNVAMKVGQTFDLTIRMRTTGILVLVAGQTLVRPQRV